MPPLDVLIIGAGLSGIGAACQLTRKLPHLRYALFEARDAIGGTWDLFRYPGVRSDTDMHSFGYGFRPWDSDAHIGRGEDIRAYVRETAEEYGVVEHIRFHRRALGLSWSSETGLWTARIAPVDGGPEELHEARFVYSCTGYYRYDAGYTPDFEGLEDFEGRVVHPQHWPEDLGVAGKRIVVIGSGATAMTLVPALAERGAQVTMLQRSPTYVVALPSRDKVGRALRRVLPLSASHALLKWRNTRMQALMVRAARARPELVRRFLLGKVARLLPASVPLEPHFSPRYKPWDQRLCLVPDGDIFQALRSRKARVVTDRVARFEAEGVRVGSGALLEADVIVTATGLRMQLMGGMEMEVDGAPVDLPERYVYKGMMISGVPNHAFATGYTNAPWTLKVDLVTDYTCRLLAHMAARGYTQVTPLPPGPEVPDGGSLVDLDAGYVRRAQGILPRQGAALPWKLHQRYAHDVALFRRGALEDEGVLFTKEPAAGRSAVLKAAEVQRARAGRRQGG